MAPPKKTLLALVGKLSALRGGGMAEDWVAALGEDIMEVLEGAPDPAAVVQDWILRDEYRPMPAQLARLVDEQRQTRGQSAAQQEKGCRDCTGGYRTGRTLRRRPSGELVVREAAVPCTCPRGMAIARGQAKVWTVKEQAEALSAERMVPRASMVPGLVAWDITDRDWRRWGLELYVDPEAERALRERADQRGGAVVRAMVREDVRPAAPLPTWHDEGADAGAW